MPGRLDLVTLQSRIAEKWPGRNDEVAKIHAQMGIGAHYIHDFFVYGVPSTGKTSVVRECLKLLSGRHAYVLCTDTMKPKSLLCSIYTQLQGYKRKNAEGYAGLNVDNMVDFFKELPVICKPGQPTSLIVLDDAHWLSRSPHLRPLLQAREFSGGASVAFVLVSQQSWGCGEWEGIPRMPTIHFPNYKPEQMATCLAKMLFGTCAQSRVPELVLRSFCEHIVSTYQDTTADLVDLATLAGHLWPLYIEPLESGKVSTTDCTKEQLNRNLYSRHFVARLQAVRRVYEPGMRILPPMPAIGASATGKPAINLQLLELPEMIKLLVVASYIASHNKATLDSQIFDAKTKSGRMRGRGAAMDSDRQVEAAKEARLKGPHSFTLQRLLTCLSYLHSGRVVAEMDNVYGPGKGAGYGKMVGLGSAASSRPLNSQDSDHEESFASDSEEGDTEMEGVQQEGAWGKAALRRSQPWWQKRQEQLGRRAGHSGDNGGSACESADILTHLNTLASMQLLSRMESDMTDTLDGAKYTCHVSEAYATGIADSLGISLLDFVKYV